MPLSLYVIIGLVGGLVLTILLKLLFNKITGKNGAEFSRLSEFFSMFITCTVIVIVIMVLITIDVNT